MAAVKESAKDGARESNGRFASGNPGGPGRAKGAKNRTTQIITRALIESLDDDDPRCNGEGATGYMKWLKWEEPKAYAALIGKLIPKDIRHGGDVRIVVHTGMGDSAEPGVN